MFEKGKTLWGIKPPPAGATSVELPVASSTSNPTQMGKFETQTWAQSGFGRAGSGLPCLREPIGYDDVERSQTVPFVQKKVQFLRGKAKAVASGQIGCVCEGIYKGHTFSLNFLSPNSKAPFFIGLFMHQPQQRERKKQKKFSKRINQLNKRKLKSPKIPWRNPSKASLVKVQNAGTSHGQ
jgi:hypothetical protein